MKIDLLIYVCVCVYICIYIFSVLGCRTSIYICYLLHAETNQRICFLNVCPDEVIRSLFYNKNNDSLITVSVYASDNFSSLKCRTTRIEYGIPSIICLWFLFVLMLFLVLMHCVYELCLDTYGGANLMLVSRCLSLSHWSGPVSLNLMM